MATARVRPLISDLVQDQLVRPITANRTQRSVDAVVSVNTRYPTVDSAIDAGHTTILVKSGTYAGFTVDNANTRIRFEPGCSITSQIDIAASECTLEFGPGCTIYDIYHNYLSHNCSVLMKNGCDITNQIHYNNAEGCILDGGGWGTKAESDTTPINAYGAIQQTNDLIVRNIHSVSDRTSTTSSWKAAAAARGDRNKFCGVKAETKTNVTGPALFANSNGTQQTMLGCHVVNTNTNKPAIDMAAPLAIYLGNSVAASGGDGVKILSGGGDSVVVGNVLKDPSLSGIDVDSGGDDVVVVGNRADPDGTGGAIDDASTGSVVASNDEESF